MHLSDAILAKKCLQWFRTFTLTVWLVMVLFNLGKEHRHIKIGPIIIDWKRIIETNALRENVIFVTLKR